MTEIERAKQEARAEAFDDVAAVIRDFHNHQAKAQTEQEWLHISYTFSNQAHLIRRKLAEPSPDANRKGL